MKESRPVPVDRFHVACCEPELCWMRQCLRLGFDKGPFVQGRGYVGHRDPTPVCLTRHIAGCPQPLPEPDPENARCCYRPAYHVDGRRRTATCATCGETVPVFAARLLNVLPTLPGVPCRHERKHGAIRIGWTECDACHGVWDRPPGQVAALEPPARTVEEMLDEVARSLQRASG